MNVLKSLGMRQVRIVLSLFQADIMTIEELSALYRSFSPNPVGDDYLDALFSLDSTAVYYRFLYLLTKTTQPSLIVELGVCTGRSTAHLAAGWPRAAILGIDSRPCDMADIQSRYSNIRSLTARSDSEAALAAVSDQSTDICFFDTVHDGPYLLREFALWMPKMRRGGILLFDDIHMFPSMSEAWHSIDLPKIELPSLHYTGFGAAIAR